MKLTLSTENHHFHCSQGAGLPKYKFRSTQTTEKVWYLHEYGSERPADLCQIVRRVEMWYTSKDIGPFSTCTLHTNLKTRFEYGISYLVLLARYYHTNGTKFLRRLRNFSNKHKLSDRNVKRVMLRDCHVIILHSITYFIFNTAQNCFLL